jgi:hypothetical protein
LHEPRCVTVNWKTVGASEIDMPVTHWTDVFERVDGESRRRPPRLTLNGALQSLRIPGHHTNGDQS